MRQVLWTFSIYLEAVAILPQLVVMQRTQNIDNLTGNYVFLLGYGVRTWKAGGKRAGQFWLFIVARCAGTDPPFALPPLGHTGDSTS